ncbi:MAG: hypothetical protein FRX49_09153 [Trebouxia sp. A1-2]|nr:MAG: hypothetical protein FRX49_09153 [Trebouxia sp. A1-2]
MQHSTESLKVAGERIALLRLQHQPRGPRRTRAQAKSGRAITEKAGNKSTVLRNMQYKGSQLTIEVYGEVSTSRPLQYLLQKHNSRTKSQTTASREPDAMNPAYLESLLQQLRIHAMLLSQADAMVGTHLEELVEQVRAGSAGLQVILGTAQSSQVHMASHGITYEDVSMNLFCSNLSAANIKSIAFKMTLNGLNASGELLTLLPSQLQRMEMRSKSGGRSRTRPAPP